MISASIHSSGFVQVSSHKLPFRCQKPSRAKLQNTTRLQIVVGRNPGGEFRYASGKTRPVNISASGRNYQEIRYDSYEDEEYRQDPFWLSLIKEAIWAFRSLLAFLVEQPSQLKYIEWPTFQSTLKTATLTLVLVALLIVALSSIDSALCYLLTLLLRRKA